VAVAPLYETIAPSGPVASNVWSPGSVRTGGTVSIGRTVTLKLPLAELPCESVALHATAVTPTGKLDPEAGVQVTATGPSTRSEAVAVKVTGVSAPVAFTATSASVSTGGVVSTTFTSNVPDVVLPAPSVAVTVTTVVPSAKSVPDACE